MQTDDGDLGSTARKQAPVPESSGSPSHVYHQLQYYCMENSPDSPSSASVPGYRAVRVSEDSQQSRKTVDLLHGASSSPDLNTRPSLPTLQLANISLSRTRTLPSRSPKHAPSIVPTLQGITFEGENLERLRRWVLGLAIGNYCLLVQLYIS
jgi:hypothetical protein